MIGIISALTIVCGIGLFIMVSQKQHAVAVAKPTKQAQDQVVVPPPPSEAEISIAFAGDTMFDWQLRPVIERNGADYPFQYVKKEIEAADYAFVNLESAFTERNEKYPGQLFWIKSHPSTLQAIKNTGFDIVSLGNNHTLDYGQAGMIDTIKYVENMGFKYIGVGRNETEAYTAKEVVIKGKKFKFLSFVRFMPDSAWVATGDKPGVAGGYDLNKVTNTIRAQKGDADYLIVYMHWGVEKTNRPAPYQKEYATQMKAAGADVIIGSHPHWLQGFEYYGDMPVAYSLGNFLFPDYVSGHSAETGVLTITFKGKEKKMSFQPYVIRNNQIQPLNGQEREQMLRYMQSISYDVEVTAEGTIINKKNSQ
ncbi:CapA family protein [Ectobacillus antri]|uniref:CapA family protein n=1 Tax=Ectobacillus antri TaxID=2486280 RepID=UPI000F59D331